MPLGSFKIYSDVKEREREWGAIKREREWGAVSNGKLPHLFIAGKSATLVPKFAMEDLRFGTIAALVLEFAVKDLSLGRTLFDDDDADYWNCIISP